ncbi:dihydropteroate synthase [Ferroplasma sp.]|uniref:dihydropteroate synthase n=1 Tax=Ferroplasma sp. TaxID=2591003 RepID=UPI00307CE7F9
MEVIFPSRSKGYLDVYKEDKNGHVIIEGRKFARNSIVFEKSTLKEFYIKNHIFEGYEEQLSENVGKKLKNKKSKIMGILNATPDSFFSGSRIADRKIIDSMLDSKPDIIDIGGESTRPGSVPVEPEKEFDRIKWVIEYVKSVSDIPISIDSRHLYTISKSMDYDIDYINDISGFSDPGMVDIAVNSNVKCIVMHMIGNPQNMGEQTHYDDIYFQINEYFYKRADNMIKRGIKPENIIMDPGIGFSKDFNGNMDILKQPWSFFIGFNTLFGTSRKGFIGKITGSSIENRLGGTIATSIYLEQNGVDILRVHDVTDNRDAINVYSCIEKY